MIHLSLLGLLSALYGKRLRGQRLIPCTAYPRAAAPSASSYPGASASGGTPHFSRSRAASARSVSSPRTPADTAGRVARRPSAPPAMSTPGSPPAPVAAPRSLPPPTVRRSVPSRKIASADFEDAGSSHSPVASRWMLASTILRMFPTLQGPPRKPTLGVPSPRNHARARPTPSRHPWSARALPRNREAGMGCRALEVGVTEPTERPDPCRAENDRELWETGPCPAACGFLLVPCRQCGRVPEHSPLADLLCNPEDAGRCRTCAGRLDDPDRTQCRPCQDREWE